MRRWIFLFLVAVVMVLVFFWWNGHRALQREFAWLKAEGLPVTLEEGGLSTVEKLGPDGEAWKKVKSAVEAKTSSPVTEPLRDNLRFVRPGYYRAMTLEPDLPIGGTERTERITWTEWDTRLKPLREALAKAPVLRPGEKYFEPDFREGFAASSQNQTISLTVARGHMYSARGHLGLHRPAEALADIDMGRKLKKSFLREDTLLEGLVESSIDLMMVAVSWEMLQHPDLNEKQLAALAKIWEPESFQNRLTHLWAGERLNSWVWLSGYQARNTLWDRENLGFCCGRSWLEEVVTYDFFKLPYRKLILPHDLAFYLHALGLLEKRTAEWAEGAPYAVVKAEVERGTTFFQALPFWQRPGYLFAEEQLSSQLKAMNLMVAALTQQRLLQAAIALERYRLQHHSYPATLQELSPAYVVAVLLDPIDHQPLRYRREAGAVYTLYSIGINGVDDGGQAKWIDPKDKPVMWAAHKTYDIVWPRAAK